MEIDSIKGSPQKVSVFSLLLPLSPPTFQAHFCPSRSHSSPTYLRDTSQKVPGGGFMDWRRSSMALGAILQGLLLKPDPNICCRRVCGAHVHHPASRASGESNGGPFLLQMLGKDTIQADHIRSPRFPPRSPHGKREVAPTSPLSPTFFL